MAYDYIESAHRLYRRFGYEPARLFEEMLRPLTDLPDVVVPDGLRIIPFPMDRSDEVRVAKNTAFEDHWGSGAVDAESWVDFIGGCGSRLDKSFVAEDISTGAIVAHCINDCYPEDDELLGRSDFIIDNLGTVPGWRGKGVASALLHHSMHAFAEEGRTHAMIEVDADSKTGASRLYRSLGFVTQQTTQLCQIQVQ
jgi:mycothiol synthase